MGDYEAPAVEVIGDVTETTQQPILEKGSPPGPN